MTTSSPGDTADLIKDLKLQRIAKRTMHVTMTPMDRYKNKYWAYFLGGIYTGKNYHVRVDQAQLDNAVNMVPGGDDASLYIEDAGDWPVFNKGYVPSGWAQVAEAFTAKRLRFLWHNSYELVSPIRGDNQITIVSITGLIRKVNCSILPLKSTRALLSYSIFTLVDGVTHIVRWWNRSKLVAEGVVVGDGAVTCNALNESGLTVECSLTYTGDVAPNEVEVEFRWPKAYQIHYSTGALVFPRTPEKLIQDNGLDDYVYLSPELDPGTYHWNILQVDDSNVVQSASIPSTSDKVIYDTPGAPTDLNVSGNAAALTVGWTITEAGCTYTVYYSDPDMPINFGSGSPTPIGPTAVDATSAVLDPIVGTAGKDFTSDFATLESSFDSAVAACNLLYAQTTFSVAFTALTDAVLAAIDTFVTATDLQLSVYKDSISVTSSTVLSTFDQMPAGMDADSWATLMGGSYAGFLCLLGQILESQAGRYVLPNGAFANTPNGAAAVGSSTTSNSGFGSALIGISIYDAAQPFVRPATVRIVVRASKAGVEEKQDERYEVEFDAAGNIIPKRPNQAFIRSLTINGSTVSVNGFIQDVDYDAIPDRLDLYVVPVGMTIDYTTPDASVNLPAVVNNQQRATVSLAGVVAGAYQIAIKARVNATGARSMDALIQLINITSATPTAVSNLEADVLRGREVTTEF